MIWWIILFAAVAFLGGFLFAVALFLNWAYKTFYRW